MLIVSLILFLMPNVLLFTLFTLLSNNIPLSLIAYFGLSVTSLLSFGFVHDTLLLVTASVIHRFYFCFFVNL